MRITRTENKKLLRSEQKAFCAMVSALLCCALLFSIFFIIAKSNHDCIGEHCSVCLAVQTGKSILGGFAIVGINAGRLFCFFALRTIQAQRMIVKPTPVSLKIKLSN